VVVKMADNLVEIPVDLHNMDYNTWTWNRVAGNDKMKMDCTLVDNNTAFAFLVVPLVDIEVALVDNNARILDKWVDMYLVIRVEMVVD
jgi:hypothetical protein